MRQLILPLICMGLSLSLSCGRRVESKPGAGAFSANCGNQNAQLVFDGSKAASGAYGVKNLLGMGDPELVLVGNQWWMIFAAAPGPNRNVELFSASLPPGASLQTYTTYPSDPNGWRISGAKADGSGIAIPVAPSSHAGAWDSMGIETVSVAPGAKGELTGFYSGYSKFPNSGNPMSLGVLGPIRKGTGPLYAGNPVMSATASWEHDSKGVGELLEPAVRYVPSMGKWVMYYTAGAWWGTPPNNTLAYAESTDGIHWENRRQLGFSNAYYNADWLYNAGRNRYEMTISKNANQQGGPVPRDIVWLMAAKPGANRADWTGERVLLQYNAPGGGAWYNSGALSPSMKYGSLSGETNRLFVYFHSYSTGKSQGIGRFYCDAGQ